MGDFGIRISRFGYDVKTAADFQLILNSSWPSLKIHYASALTITPDGINDLTIYTHSLGYAPVFQVFDNNTYGIDIGSGSRYDSAGFVCTTTTIYLPGGSLPAGTYTIFLYVFRQDLSTAYTAPNVNTVSISSGLTSADYGLKVAKAGKATSSTDLRDYAIHSGTQNLTIAQVTPNTINPSGSWTVTHNLGYKPAWLFFGHSGANYQVYNAVRTTADNNSITFIGAQSPLFGKYSAVIFKDPVLQV